MFHGVTVKQIADHLHTLDSSFGSSDCTLRSLGIPTPTKTTGVPTLHLDQFIDNTIEPKKPSYLNLACTVNGYSNITNYDSKLRENFRLSKSRDISPIRPQEEYHANIVSDSKFLTPNYAKPIISETKMAESKSQTILHSSYSSSTMSSFISKKELKMNGIQTLTSSNFEYTNASRMNGNKTVSESTNENFSSTSTTTSTQGTKTKSFIQQRVERLYGPGALAQGFFIMKRTKDRLSESENGDVVDESSSVVNSPVVSVSSPALPVLRHLRPEFRAQLPILSPKRGTNETLVVVNGKKNGFTTEHSSLPSKKETNGLNESVVTVNGSPKLIVENKENNEKLLEEIPAAPQVILPITNGNEVVVNGNSIISPKQQIKDGHYFLKILKNETDRLIGLAERTEVELEEKKTALNDDVLGYLRSASGKARLLVTQKMQQFEGLCHKNINQIEGEPFPTTPEDLQGFWDMVMLQVTQVDELFVELDTLRENNWIIPEKPKDTVDTASLQKQRKILTVKKVVNASTEAQRKQREADRKKMLEERRKAMRNKQIPTSEQNIEIFVPESS